MNVCDLETHLHLIQNYCMNAKFDENRSVKGIKVLMLKGFCFEKVWCLCLIHGKSMVWQY